MQTNDLFTGVKSYSVINTLSLLFYWLVGLMIGAFLSYNQDSAASLMYMVLRAPVSIVSLVISTFLPFLLTVLSVYIHRPFLVRMVCCIKAAAIGYCVVSLFRLMHSAAWVVAFLLLFSDSVFQIFLFRLWMRVENNNQSRFFSDCLLCAFVGVLAILFNYLFLAPVLQDIF